MLYCSAMFSVVQISSAFLVLLSIVVDSAFTGSVGMNRMFSLVNGSFQYFTSRKHFFVKYQQNDKTCIEIVKIKKKPLNYLDSGTGTAIYIGPLVQFLKFLSTFQKSFKTNYTSIESTNKELLIHKRNWVWHHPGGGHAPLTEKAVLLLKLVWSLP